MVRVVAWNTWQPRVVPEFPQGEKGQGGRQGGPGAKEGGVLPRASRDQGLSCGSVWDLRATEPRGAKSMLSQGIQPGAAWIAAGGHGCRCAGHPVCQHPPQPPNPSRPSFPNPSEGPCGDPGLRSAPGCPCHTALGTSPTPVLSQMHPQVTEAILQAP